MSKSRVYAIAVTHIPGNPDGETWSEKLGEGELICLAGDWSEEASHDFMAKNYPDAHSYKLEHRVPQNDSCYWPD